MWATFRRNREETGQAIRKWRGGKKEPPRKRRFICPEETREPSRKPRQKKTFRFSFHPTTSWNTPLLHSLWAVRSHFLRNVDIVGLSFPNIWLACLLPFRPLNQDYRQWNEKLIKANFFWLKRNLIIMIPQPGPWLAIVLTGLWSPLSDKTSQPSCHSHPKPVKDWLLRMWGAGGIRCWEEDVHWRLIFFIICVFLVDFQSATWTPYAKDKCQRFHPYPLLAPNRSYFLQCIFTPSPEPVP